MAVLCLISFLFLYLFPFFDACKIFFRLIPSEVLHPELKFNEKVGTKGLLLGKKQEEHFKIIDVMPVSS